MSNKVENGSIVVSGMTDIMDVEDKKGFTGLFNISQRFAVLNKLISRDLNKNTNVPRFSKYSREDIIKFLSNPYTNQKQLRDAVTYIYGASSHFARLIQYFTSLTCLYYVVSPYKVDVNKVNKKILRNNYRKVLNLLSSANIETELRKIIKTCFKYDVFYGTIWMTSDNITIQQLPADYCAISTIEGNVFNVTFNFSYFDTYPDRLDYYPEEFRLKYYNVYKVNTTKRWVELDSPNSFAIKFNDDVTDYSLPPFAGLLREVYDLEDYKDLKLTKTELDNYALVTMKLLMDDDGNWLIDEGKAKRFFNNLSAVLPDQIGAVLSPMALDKIDFDKTAADDADTIAEAEENLFTAAGVSSLIFNNPKASANALLTSIKADQALTYSIVQSIQDMLNRFIQAQPFGKNFVVNFLDVSPYNAKEASDQYLKACQYGAPLISRYCASLGVDQAEMEAMNLLETEVLGLQDKFKPLVNSSNASAESLSEEAGRPRSDDTELSDSGEQSREDGVEDGDW